MKKEVKTFNSRIDYDVEYRKVRYPRLEFRTGDLILILPENYNNEKSLLKNHERWILRKQKAIESALKLSKNKKLEEKSLEDTKKLILKFCAETKEKVNKITFKQMKSKWASCSNKRSLMFNKDLRFLPKSLIKYVVFHEITHFKEKKHNEKFWRLISRKFKNYKNKEKDLFIYWFLIQKRKRGRKWT